MVGAMEITLGEEWSRVLSPREREIALLVARGLSNKEVARELGLSDGTVKISLHGIFRKLGTKSRYSLIVQGHAAVGARQISSS
jgi:DNA-binding NarL/FixJ family response regulator